jgi:hypothetical protein
MRKGQAVVIILLMIGVVLTVGLAIVSRSITEVSVTTTQEESSRALEAAEAGIERAIGGAVVGVSQGTIPSTNSSFNVINSFLGNASTYVVPIALVEGDVATIDLAGYTGNTVRVCWGQSPDQPSIEVIVYYTNGGVAGAGRNGDSPTGISGFWVGPANGCPSATGYSYFQNIQLSAAELGIPAGSQVLVMRVRMINTNNPQRILLAGSADIPAQGNEVVSTGQSGLAAQKVKATVVKSDLPPMFDSALFSGTSLVQ